MFNLSDDLPRRRMFCGAVATFPLSYYLIHKCFNIHYRPLTPIARIQRQTARISTNLIMFVGFGLIGTTVGLITRNDKFN